jgi:hypothetical protein
MKSQHQAGKGSKRRKGENLKKFSEGWDQINWPSKSKKSCTIDNNN